MGLWRRWDLGVSKVPVAPVTVEGDMVGRRDEVGRETLLTPWCRLDTFRQSLLVRLQVLAELVWTALATSRILQKIRRRSRNGALHVTWTGISTRRTGALSRACIAATRRRLTMVACAPLVCIQGGILGWRGLL